MRAENAWNGQESPQGALWTRWRLALSVLAEPDVLAFLAICGALLVLAARGGSFEPRHLFVILLGATSAACFGALLASRWRDRTESGQLQERGRAALSNLKLLLVLLTRTEGRLREYVSRIQARDAGDGSILYLEETLEKLGFLHENTVKAIENWRDLLPEADIRSRLRRMEELRRQLEVLRGRRGHLEERIRAESDREAPAESLIPQMAEIQIAADRATAELSRAEAELGEFLFVKA